MDIIEKEQILEREYIDRYVKILYWTLNIMGFNRFNIKNGKIVMLTSNTLAYRTILLIMADLGVSYLLYISVVSKNYLKIPDGMCLIHFETFSNMLLINLTFINRKSGLIIIKQSFKIDLHLGLEETKFMRDAEIKMFYFMCTMVAIVNVFGGIFLYRVYDVSMTIHFIGSLYFFWLFFCYDDYCFYLLYSIFIALRARYLNVALARLGNMKVEYLSNYSLFNTMLWRNRYDDLVTFQCRASLDDYVTALQMLFEMKGYVDAFYRFTIGLGVWTIVTGTFVSSQTFVERIKNPSALEQERTYIIVGWALISWFFLFYLAIFLSMFQQQIEQTKLVCACIQLKPNNPTNIYKLTKRLLRILERRETRISVYNIFYLDAGFLLRMAASTLVYITVQLQLAFPKLSSNTRSNTTADYKNCSQEIFN